MLVISRKAGQRVHVGGAVVITVVKISGGHVRIGIEAPPELSILREELLQRLSLAGEPGSVAGESHSMNRESGCLALFENRCSVDVAPR